MTFMTIRHRIAKTIVLWLLKHSGIGAVIEADHAESKALVAGVRQDLSAFEPIIGTLATQSNTTTRLLVGVLQKHQAWEASDRGLMIASRRLITRQKRAADKAAAEAQLAAAPIDADSQPEAVEVAS